MVQSYKMVRIQVVPEKSGEVLDLTGGGRKDETQLCVYSSIGGTEGCGVQRNNNV